MRELVQHFSASAAQAHANNSAGTAQAFLALSDALAGNVAEAKTAASQAMQLANDSASMSRAGLALALARDSAAAQKLAASLNQAFPQATVVQRYCLPAIRAVLALNQGKPQDALGALTATAFYDSLAGSGMIAVYLRGQA